MGFPQADFTSSGHGVNTDILQAHLSYSRFWKTRSVVVRLGQLPSAFGSFLLRYDDSVNPLIDLPMAYGYYYKPVSNQGLTGAQVDATLGKLDARAQFVNSSPANPRSIFDRDQYGNWAGGAGYTIRQGFRVGISAYRGPYLDRNYPLLLSWRGKAPRLAGIRLRHRWAMGPRSLERIRRVAAVSDGLSRDSDFQSAHRVYRSPASPPPAGT
jgi:hypothetical protein